MKTILLIILFILGSLQPQQAETTTNVLSSGVSVVSSSPAFPVSMTITANTTSRTVVRIYDSNNTNLLSPQCVSIFITNCGSKIIDTKFYSVGQVFSNSHEITVIRNLR